VIGFESTTMQPFNDHMLEFVDAFVHDTLEPAQAAVVEEHCAHCPICRVALEEAQKRVAALKTVPASEAGDDLLARTELLIDDHIAREAAREAPRLQPAQAEKQLQRRRMYRMGVVAGLFGVAAVVIATLQVHYETLSASPYDLQVLGERQLLPGELSSLRVMLFDHNRSEPLSDVPVTIELASKDQRPVIQLASFRTDARGTGSPAFRIPEQLRGDFELRVSARLGGRVEKIVRDVKIARSWRVMVTTDKPVYQPGQTIHLRSLALQQPSHKPVAGETADFRLTDPRGNVVFQARTVTSKFGIVSANCPLADEIIEGNYQIECRVGETSSALTVEVKKYVLPKFRITAVLDRTWYAPGDVVRGTLEGAYFFGQPVANGQATVEIVATDVAPHVLASFECPLDAHGRGQFEYRLPDHFVGRERDRGDANLSLTITLADAAGQSQSQGLSCVVTNRPLRVEVIPESGKLVREVQNRLYLLATYADGQPAAHARIAVSGFDEELTTDQLGACTLELKPRLSVVGLALSVRDDEGRAVSQQVQLECDASHEGFALRVENPVIDGGETLQLSAIGHGIQPVFVDFIKDRQLLLTTSIEMAGGAGAIAVDLPPELSGAVQVCAYRFSATGSPIRKSQVIHVTPASELRIETTADRLEYRPGDTARLKFRIRDSRGRPVPGALSLAAVDEAVFSVLSQRPGTEQMLSAADEELLRPVYAISRWSPEAQRGMPGRDQFERALFSRTAEQGLVGSHAALEQLVPFLDNNRRVLEVLNRPDWRQLARDRVPQELYDLVDSGDGLHTLTDSTYPAKQHQIERERHRGQQFANGLWFVFFMALLIFVGISVLMLLERNPFATLVVVLLFLCVIVPLLLPAVQQAREAARRTMAVNDMKQLGLAMENFKDAHGKFPQAVGETSQAAPPRVRQWFPETLLWRPELITNDQGEATLEVPLADSITTWRLTASAVTAKGALGGATSSVRVFQPFFVDLNLPVALTRGDEVTVQAVVYNYLEEPQTVLLDLTEADWFEPLGTTSQTVELPPGGVRSVGFPIRVKQVGRQELQVNARGGELSDAIRKSIDVVPDGRPVERIVNGVLADPVEMDLEVPATAIEGSPQAVVRIYPSMLSQLVEGLEGIFRMPYGCFEQTSSTTYPNVLALDYLHRTGQKAPNIEAMARNYIHLGYQRLLSFEVAGGGFDWFGRPPANRTLTAYGLMEFEDMARVHDVDPQLIERTRKWLLNQCNRDGSWDPEGHAMHDDPARRGRSADARYRTTAYIGWAVFRGRPASAASNNTVEYLLARQPREFQDPYDLALVCNALLAIEGGRSHAQPYLARLYDLRQTSTDHKQVWWSPAERTVFYGSRDGGSIETTALCTLAFLSPHARLGSVQPAQRVAAHRALNWIASRRDSRGTWASTQATVLALKALLAGAEQPAADEKERRIEISLDGKTLDEIVIPAAQGGLVKQFELKPELTTGRHALKLTDRNGAAPGYQVDFRYHVPQTAMADAAGPLSIGLKYDRSELSVNDTVTAQAVVENRSTEELPMVVLDLPIPAGFAVETEGFERLREKGQIAKYQVTPTSVIVYLRSLGTEQLVLNYTLRATVPVKTTTGPAIAYEYYSPEIRSESGMSNLVVLGN
jgi:hypothetical protein